MLTQKATFLPLHSCPEQSPKCLIANHEGPCIHKHCLSAYKKPTMFGISVSEFYNKEQFTEFDVIPATYGRAHIIPRNPNPGSGDGFEGFRQSMNAITHLAGVWPSNLKVVPREHVELRWIEFMDEYPHTNPETFQTVWLQRLDVQEYAHYVGPLTEQTTSIDVSVIEKPTKGYTFIDCTKKDNWCHCGSEGDWCGEGCHQPHNNPELRKGGNHE